MAGSPVPLAEREGLSYRDRCRYQGVDPLTCASVDPYLKEYDASSFSSDMSSNTSSSNAEAAAAAAAARIGQRAMANPLFPANDCVAELRPEEVRWFYQEEGEKKWLPFDGYDSLRLECKYREVLCTRADGRAGGGGAGGGAESQIEKILVRGGLFEADIAARSCRPIYWSDMSDPDARGKSSRVPKYWRKSTFR